MTEDTLSVANDHAAAIDARSGEVSRERIVIIRRPWVIWAAAVTVYVLAVFHRTSLGVAGLQAGERFHLGPTALSVFTVLQIGVYAVMQVPTGLLVDRFGPRAVLTVAAVLMGAGQILFAVATSYPLALAARAVLGVGDAMTFVSVLRLVAAHFPAARYSLVALLTAALGAGGNLVATLPLTGLLGTVGWTTTFALTGALTAGYALVVLLRVRDVPHGQPVERSSGPLRAVPATVRGTWRVPGTRLGFWVHFTTMFAPTVLGLLWGFPYLVEAQGLSKTAASSVLGVLVLTTVVGSPVIGQLITRNPHHRIPMVVGYLGIAAVTWAVLLGWPGGHLPVPVLTVAFSVLAFGGPMSGIGFALARDYNPMHRVGTATGVVNQGGFLAITVSAFAIGVLLQASGSYRVALLSVVVLLLLGSWRCLVWWRRARAEVFAAESRGEQVPVRIHRTRFDAPVPACA
ncbi:sugar phosphate permease [Labedaea rhizosphaerae]|uniref:Sugar phosphate permease n=1 Tax=Labedaea rhizosphaerae TaxID=598644 RepID=A0A4R6SBH7_LABRH|nr:sugar phosphate permease [Labedaea rhizosphaerae]